MSPVPGRLPRNRTSLNTFWVLSFFIFLNLTIVHILLFFLGSHPNPPFNTFFINILSCSKGSSPFTENRPCFLLFALPIYIFPSWLTHIHFHSFYLHFYTCLFHFPTQHNFFFLLIMYAAAVAWCSISPSKVNRFLSHLSSALSELLSLFFGFWFSICSEGKVGIRHDYLSYQTHRMLNESLCLWFFTSVVKPIMIEDSGWLFTSHTFKDGQKKLRKKNRLPFF